MTKQEFIEKYLPNYYSRTDVALLNDLCAVSDGMKSEQELAEELMRTPFCDGEVDKDIENLEMSLLDESVRAVLKTVNVYEDTDAKRWVYKKSDREKLEYRDLFGLIFSNMLDADPSVYDLLTLEEFESRYRYRYVG